MEIKLQLFILFLATLQCNGHLLSDLILGTHSKIHDVAGGLVDGISHGLNLNFQLNAQRQTPQTQPPETVIVIVEDQNNHHRPHGHKPHRNEHIPNYNNNGPGYHENRPYENAPGRPDNYINENYEHQNNYNNHPHPNDYNGNINNGNQGYDQHQNQGNNRNRYPVNPNHQGNYNNGNQGYQGIKPNRPPQNTGNQDYFNNGNQGHDQYQNQGNKPNLLPQNSNNYESNNNRGVNTNKPPINNVYPGYINIYDDDKNVNNNPNTHVTSTTDFTTNKKPSSTKIPDNDGPLFVPLNEENRDDKTNSAPKRDTENNNDEDEFNIDIRMKE